MSEAGAGLYERSMKAMAEKEDLDDLKETHMSDKNTRKSVMVLGLALLLAGCGVEKNIPPLTNDVDTKNCSVGECNNYIYDMHWPGDYHCEALIPASKQSLHYELQKTLYLVCVLQDAKESK